MEVFKKGDKVKYGEFNGVVVFISKSGVPCFYSEEFKGKKLGHGGNGYGDGGYGYFFTKHLERINPSPIRLIKVKI